MKKNELKIIIKGIGIVLLIFLLSTCDVGLGPSVDTTAPNVSIASPVAGAVMSGTVSLGGEASDDGVIESVVVTLTRIDSMGSSSKSSGESIPSYTALLDTDAKKWSYSLPTIDENGNTLIEDGTYQITVNATDSSKKESYRQTTFTVDNTPPVIIFMSPELRSDSLNYNLQFEGKIYDLTTVQNDMTLYICDSNGVTLASKTATLTGSGEWKVTFNGKEDLFIDKEGESPKLTAGEYHYYLTATDAAGNTNTYFFHKADIYTESFSPDTLEVSEWAKFDKGDIEEESSRPGFIKVSGIELNKTEAQEWEESIRINIPALEGSPSFVFSREQVASITFSNIGGETFLNEGDSIVGSVTPPAGVDAPFKNDTFKAYISRQEIDENDLGSLTPAVASITTIGTSRNFSISTGGRGGGTYYVYIEIQNTSGRKFTAKQSFKISLSTPKLTISNLPNLQEIISDYAFKIEGKALVSTGEYGCNLEYVLQKDDGEESASVPVTVNDSDGVWSLEIPDEDGTYAYTFTAKSNGFNAQLSRTVVLDTTNPTAEIVSLSQNENGSKVTANGTANDSLSGLSKIEYCFVEADKTPTLADWKPISSGSLANWKLVDIDSSQLAEKDFRLYIKVTDAAENTFTTSKDITIDKAAPVLQVTTNAGWKANEIKTMSGTATDTHFKTLSVSFNGEDPVAVPFAEDGSWSWTPADSTVDGTYTVVFEAEDTTGRRTKETTDFTLDRVGPDLKVITLSNGQICTAEENEDKVLSISGTASDSLAGLKSIQYKVNNDEYKSMNVSQNWTLNIKDLPEGDNSLQVKAVDNTDNVTELPVINFKTDYKSPEVWFGTTSAEVSEINVSDDVILTGKIYDYANTDESDFKYSLSYTCGDGESRTVSADGDFAWDKDGIDDNDPTYRWSWTLPKQDSEGNSNDGRYTFTLSATDIAGRTVTKTRTVCMDTTGPEINTILSDNDSFQSITNTINVSCSDLLSGVDRNRIFWKLGGDASSDDDAVPVTNNSAVVNFGTEGSEKSLTFIAYDKSGNRSYKTYTGLTVDTAPPVLQDVFGTAPQYIKAGKSFSLIAAAIGDSAVAATDGVLIDKIEVIAKKNNVAQTASGQEAGYWYKSNNINQSSVAASVFKSIPAFSGIAANDGTWMVTLAVYDKSAQKTEKTFNFTIDATPPVVHVDTPVSGSFITGNTVELRGNIDDSENGSGIESVALTISGKKDGVNSSVPQSASLNVRNWSAVLSLEDWDEGTFSVSATATDRAGNVSTTPASATYKIDQNKPVVSPITIKVGENETSSSWLNGNFTASGGVTDTLGLSKDNFNLQVKKDGTALNGISPVTKSPPDTDTEYTWSCAVTAGTSGSYEITVGAADNSGKQATSVTRTVQIDKDAPVLTISNVADGAVLSGNSYTIRGTARDMPAGAHAGITSLQYKEDSGAWQDITIAENWIQSIQLGSGGLAEGNHTIEIRANDDAGNNATNVSRSFMVDLGNPTITMTAVAEANKYIKAPLTLSGTVTDTNPLSTGADGSMTVTAYVNGSEVTGSGAATYNKTAGTWSFTLPADTDGLKTVKIIATDAAGKTSEVTETITVDKTAPTVTVTNPGSVSQGFTLTASAYDMGKGVAWVKYSWDNSTWNDMTSGSSWTKTFTTEDLGAEGEKTIYVKASDGLNETAVSEISFYLDTAEPTLSVTASTSATYTKEDYTLTINASDANLKDVTVTARKDGTALTQGWPKVFTAQSGETTIDETVTLSSTAGDGYYIFSITATDKAGKSSQSETKTIVLDTTAPVISVTSPQTTSYITGSTVEIRGSLEEASSGSGIDSVALTVSGKKNGENSTSTPAVSVSGNEWSLVLPLDGWDEGSLSVRATATDRAGNVSSTPATASYKLDQNKPVASNITIKVGTSETESSWLKGDFTARGRVTDTLGLSKDNFTIEVKKDGTALNGISPVTTRVSDTEYTWSLAVDADTSGQYEIKVGARDLSGKYADYVTRSVQIDGEVPVLTIDNVENDAILSGNSYTIRGTALDMPAGTHAGITSLQYRIDSGDWQDITIAENWIQSIQLGSGGLAEGNHTIEIRANDAAGNNATNVSRSFMVDLNNPEITMTAVDEANKYINAPLTLSGTVTDTNPLSTGATGSMTVKAYVNGSEVTGSSAATYNKTAGTWSFTLPADTDGLKTVKIIATDAAGKTSEVSETITVDKTAPTVTVVNPGSVSQGFTLTASAYDMGKGVAWVKYSLDNSTWTDMTSGSSWTVELTTAALGAEGEKTIYVKASDGLNESEPVATSFYLDTADPLLTVSASPDANYTNGAYTLTINATDANLRDVVVTAKKDGSELNEGWPKTLTATNGAVTNQTATLTAAESSDGTYLFNITATDNAGKTAFASKTITIDKTAPTVSDGYATPSTSATENASYRFSGTASDTSGSGIAKVEISFTAAGAANTVIEANKVEASGQASWSYTLVFADQTNVFKTVFETEGNKAVHVRATDTAGNEGAWVTKEFVYDKGKPTSSIASYKNDGVSGFTTISANSFETGKSFSLRGSTSDSYGIESVAVYQKNGDEDVLISETGLTGTTSWTISNLPRNPESPADALTTGSGENIKPVSGTYKFYTKATDKAGKTTDSSVITITVDTTAPTVSITAPTAGMTGESSLSGDSYTFRGSSDDDANGVGIEKIMYAFVTAGDNFDSEVPSVTEWQEQNAVAGSWSIPLTLTSGTGNPAEGTLNEGHWYLFAKAVDKAGNESPASNVHFHVDKASPVLTVTSNGINGKENEIYYYKTDAETFSLAGTATDSYGIASVSIETTIGNQNPVTSSVNVENSIWTHSVTVPADQAVALKITATDKSGKAVVKRYTLYRDMTAPLVTIISPAVGESLMSNTKTLKGTASDPGSGVTNVSYRIMQDGESEPVKTGTISLNGESWSVDDVQFGSGQGTFNLIVTAKDALDNETSSTQTFYVDTANPTLSEEGIGSGGLTTKDSFSLSGFVSDSNALAATGALTITADKDGFQPVSFSLSDAENEASGFTLVTASNRVSLGATEDQEGSYKWNKTFTVGSAEGALADGTYVFTVTAKDVASKSSVLQRTVKIDTTAPTFSPKTEGGNDYIDYTGTDSVLGSDNKTWRKTSVVTFSVKATDETGGSGLSTVEYAINGGNTGFLKKAADGITWTTSVPLNEGSNGIQIIATDVAGNVTRYPAADYEAVYVDTQLPLITIANGSDLLTKDSFLISGTSTDEGGSGIASVKAKIGETEYTMDSVADGAWSVTFNTSKAAQNAINKLADGTHTITITATDNAGRTSSVTKKVTIDTTAPAFTSPAFTVGTQAYTTTAGVTWYGSTSLDVTGSLTEANGIESISWKIDGSDADYRSFDRTENGTSYTFTSTIPVSSSVNGMKVLLKAVDKAGNESTSEVSGINVDIDAPTASIQEPAGTPLLNGKNALPVKVSATDVGSGIKQVSLKIGSQDFSEPDSSTTSNVNGVYTLSIAADKIAAIEGTQAVAYIQAKDYTDKTQTMSFSFKKDTVDPEVSITMPYADSVLNKTVTVKGTASDDQELEKVKLYYSTADELPEYGDDSWTLLETYEGSAGYNWSKSIDSTAEAYNVISSDGKKHLHFMAVATDKAQNCDSNVVAGSGKSSRSFVSCTVDQLSDCPVITFSNITADGNGLLRSTQTIYGSIEDDDGTVQEFRVSENANSTWKDSDSVKCTVKNGSWTYTDTDSVDGSKTLYFMVKDALGNVFVTPEYEEVSESGLYIIGTGETVKSMKPLQFRIDMNPPQIYKQTMKVKAYATGTASGNYADAELFESVKDTLVLGGSKDLVDFFVSASDPNGIARVSVKLGTKENAGTATGEKDVLGNDIWKISGIDVSDLSDGSQTLVVTAVDVSEFNNSLMMSVRVDNTPPTFDVTSHKKATDSGKKDELVTGIVTLKGISADTVSGVESIKYMIPTTTSAESITAASDGWLDMEVTEGTSTWKVLFTGNTLLKTYANTTYGTETGNNTNIWKVPVYFRLEDKVGNTSVDKSFYYNVDPDGDRPKVTVSYPADNAILGGTIRIFGTAEDNESVSAVYMQVDVDGNGVIEDSDKTYLKNVTVNSESDVKVYSVIDFDADSKLNDGAWWGIKATGSVSWNQIINSVGEFDPSEENQKKIKVRFRALDNNGLCSLWSDFVEITIDKTAPRIGSSESLKLVQYADNDAGSGSITATQDYRTDMWITGKWWLTGSVEDESGIASITLDKCNDDDVTISGSVSNNSYSGVLSAATCSAKDFSANATSGYSMKIPLDTTTFSAAKKTVSFKFIATDKGDNPQTATQVISIKYDNTAPSIGSLKHNSLSIGDGSGDTVIMEQSNKTYSIEGTATDDGSGFSRLAIYFKRADNDGSNPRVYNPALPKAENKTDVLSIKTNERVYMSEGLPMLYMASVSRPSEDSLSFTSSEELKNIRKGGLVLIGGVERLITGITSSGTTYTVTFSPSVDVSYTEAEFVYALIIDNLKTETPVYNDDTGELSYIANDDGDGVIESVEKSGGSYNWTISIDSKQIPDGPIDICCVAFDQASNISEVMSVTTSVQNNRPAIANVWLGTDYDGDGEISSGTGVDGDTGEKKKVRTVITNPVTLQERLDYDANWKKTASSVSIDVSKTFKAVGRVTTIEPEIVGGNGDLHYYYAKDDSSDSSYNRLSTDDTATAYVTDSTSGDTTSSVLTFKVTGEGADASLDGFGNGTHTFHIKMYDTTENLVTGQETMTANTSQWAALSIKMNVNVVDTVPPTAEIKPFYWKNSNDNSLYENSLENGHIELSADWQNTTSYDSTAENGINDADPKVSGRIKIQGSAEDETCLRSVSIKFDDYPGLTDFVELAVFSGGSWTESGDMGTNGYHFKVTDPDGVRSTGHKVTWQLDLDTSKIPDMADLDKSVHVKVKDSGGNDNSRKAVYDENGTVTSVIDADIPSYRMDIVPYITDVKTSLSTIQKKQPTVYSRTALGHYPVRADETVEIVGFNIDNSGATLSMSGRTSGKYDVVVNEISSLNNMNANDSKGSYAGVTTVSTGDYTVYSNYYNRKPNNMNNNLLTDDVVFDVWEFDNTHIVPISGKIEQPVMKINPNNDKVGFAFVNGPLYFSMGGGTGSHNYSYTYWMGSYDFFTSVGFTYDKLGYSYGVAAGGDINSDSADKFQLMSSRWGNASREQKGSYGNTNSLRLESIGQKGDAAGNNTGTNYYDKQRFQSPSLTTSVHQRNNKDYTYLYMAYYDQMNDEIRFRYGYTNSTTKTDFQAFTDKETAGAPYTYANSASSVVQMVTGSNTGRNSGSYVSIGVVSSNGTINNATDVDDVVVLVWYDATNKCLMYTYNDTPVSNRQGNKTATGWSTPVRVFDEKSDMASSGEYCKVAVDNDGGVHIACYDPVNLDLNYAYLPSTFGGKPTKTSDFNTCVVDANGVTGSNLTLDVAKVGDNWIPYIGYYITSAIRPKLAYRIDTSAYAPYGSVDDEFTGAWETTIVPTSMTVQMQSNQHNDINVAVWKDKGTGVIKTTYTTGTNSNTNVPDGYKTGDNSRGQIYGNGKTDANGNAYPILGYAVKSGASSDSIETAQMR